VRPPHSVTNWGGKSPIEAPLMSSDVPVAYRITNGKAVSINGKNATVKNTKRFLKTSLHSFFVMAQILFII